MEVSWNLNQNCLYLFRVSFLGLKVRTAGVSNFKLYLEAMYCSNYVDGNKSLFIYFFLPEDLQVVVEVWCSQIVLWKTNANQ